MSACYANQGPSQKRVRPAPMGRAFRVVKRTAHLTIAVTEKAAKAGVAPARGARKAVKPKAGGNTGGAAPKPRAGAAKSAKKATA